MNPVTAELPFYWVKTSDCVLQRDLCLSFYFSSSDKHWSHLTVTI